MNEKPEWSDLPYALREELLWDMELDYDSYDSSKAEEIHMILCGNVSSPNELAIANYYKALTLEALRIRARQVEMGFINQIEQLHKSFGKLVDIAE